METTDGFDPAVWDQMANQLGLQSLAIPEAYGGSGFTFVELTVVFEEMGVSLICAPYFSTVGTRRERTPLVRRRIRKDGPLPGIAEGTTKATFALTQDSGKWDVESVALLASGGPEWTLSGHKMYVIDGHTSDLILVVARTGGGAGTGEG